MKSRVDSPVPSFIIHDQSSLENLGVAQLRILGSFEADTMKRQAPYEASGNRYSGSQRQHISDSDQRMLQNARLNNFLRQPDSHLSEEDKSCLSSKSGRWQWCRDDQKVSGPMPSHSYNEGPGGNGNKSINQAQMSDLATDRQGNKEPSIQAHEQDMEIGYGDSPLPMNFEGVEQKFVDEIMKINKDRNDAEDAENARHREKLVEINMSYQEKLSSIRVRQASLREEFLRRESQARLLQYHQTRMSHYPGNAADAHDYYASAAVATREAHQPYSSTQYESYQERRQFSGRERSQGGTETRVPYPGGRLYGSGRYY